LPFYLATILELNAESYRIATAKKQAKNAVLNKEEEKIKS